MPIKLQFLSPRRPLHLPFEMIDGAEGWPVSDICPDLFLNQSIKLQAYQLELQSGTAAAAAVWGKINLRLKCLIVAQPGYKWPLDDWSLDLEGLTVMYHN